jgi:hypothetical protein
MCVGTCYGLDLKCPQRPCVKGLANGVLGSDWIIRTLTSSMDCSLMALQFDGLLGGARNLDGTQFQGVGFWEYVLGDYILFPAPSSLFATLLSYGE